MCYQPTIYPNFDNLLIANNDLSFNAHNNIIRSYQTAADNNFNLLINQARNGGIYKLLITKTILGDVVITLPLNAIVVGDIAANTITLSGALNEQFLIEFSFDGINLLFILGGSSVGPSAGSSFSPNVIPFID